MAFKIAGGNTDDHQPLEPITAALQGKGVADKRYIIQTGAIHLIPPGTTEGLWMTVAPAGRLWA